MDKSVGERISELLEMWVQGRSTQEIPGNLLAELLSDLEGAARRAAESARLPSDAEPLRLSKARIRQMLDCERHMLALLAHPAGSQENEIEITLALVLGVLLDVLSDHRVTTGRLDEAPLDLALDLLRARGGGAEGVVNWVGALDAGLRTALETDLFDRRSRLLDGWPHLSSDWWPRVQDRALLVLADGEVIVDSRADIVLGGPPTGRRAAIIETKSRKFRREDLEDALLYALLVAFRDGVAPECVITCYGESGEVHDIWIGENDLRSATRRLGDTILLAGDLASGRTPVERPSHRCGWCPDRNVCPSALAFDAGGPGADEFEEGVSDDEPF